MDEEEIMLDFGYYNMDCMEGMKDFPDKYFDLAVVDPEYGLREHGGKSRSTYVVQKNGSRSFVSDGHYDNRGWDMHPPDKTYFEELIRVSKNQIIFGCNYFDFPLTGGRIVWDKCNDGSDQSGAEIAYNSMSNKVEIFRFMWRGMMQGKSVMQGTIQQGNKKLNEKRMELAKLSIIVSILMSFFCISCITDCVWYLIFGIAFLIYLCVIMFMRGDFAVSVVLILIIILVSIFVMIWIYDEWDLLQPLIGWKE